MSCTVLQHASLYRRRSQSVKRSWHGMYENDDVSLCSADQAVIANKDKEQRAGSTQKDLAVIAGLCCAPVFPLLNWKWVPAVCHLSFSPFGSVLMLFPYLSITRPSSSLLPRSCLKPSFYLKWNLMLWCVFSEQSIATCPQILLIKPIRGPITVIIFSVHSLRRCACFR